MSKKLQSIPRPGVETSKPDAQQTASNDPHQQPILDRGLKGTELFSFFTANIIKEQKVFTR